MLQLYRRQRLGVFALLATFLVVAGMLAYGHAENLMAHERVTRTLELEGRLTSFRVWLNRVSNEVLASALGGGAPDMQVMVGDRMRARGELEAIRELVASEPTQVASVDELANLLGRIQAVEDAAMAAAGAAGPAGAGQVLEASTWRDDRARTRAITTTMLARARDDFQRRDAQYGATMRAARAVMVAGLVLMAATLVYLLRQLRAAQRAREEVLRANALAHQRLGELEAVLETVPAAVLMARDPDCLQVEGNRAAFELLRVPPGGSLSLPGPGSGPPPGFHFRREGVAVAPADLPLQQAARTGARVEGQHLDVVLDDGTVRHVLATASPLRDAAGAPRGAVAAFVDVTEMVRVAHELLDTLERNRTLLQAARRSELLYREMARSFPDGAIALFDHDLRFLMFEGTRLALPGDAASRVGRTLAEIVPPDVAARIEPVHRDALRGIPGRVEVSVGGRTLEIRAAPIRDDSGAVIMGVATSQDVTEDRALRTQLAVSSRLASMGTLVAGVAHEVNNPLAGLLGSLSSAIAEQRALAAQLRAGGAPGPDALARAADEVVEVLLDAQVGGNRIARVVKDLSLFGRPNPMRTRVRLGDVVTSSMRWLPASVGHSSTVHVEDLGAPDVHASAGQLEQVVVNLVTNAAFAVPEGRRGQISIRIAPSPSGGAVLEVRDDGQGIDAATMERIFDPFFTTRDVGSGMGLGLPICHAIVAAHGGSLTATSVPGQGSTFRVELPAAAPPEGETPPSRRV